MIGRGGKKKWQERSPLAMILISPQIPWKGSLQKKLKSLQGQEPSSPHLSVCD